MKHISFPIKALAFACTLFVAEKSSAQLAYVNPVVNTHTPELASEPIKAVGLEVYPIPGTSKILMMLENPGEQKLYITIRGSSGKTYSQFIQKKSVRTVFDLSNADDGAYTLFVQHGKQKFTKKFSLTTKYQEESKQIKLD